MKKLIITLAIALPMYSFSQVAPFEKMEIPSAKNAIREHTHHVNISKKIDDAKISTLSTRSMNMASTESSAASSASDVQAITYLTSSVSIDVAREFLMNFSQSGQSGIFSNSNVDQAVSYFKNNIVSSISTTGNTDIFVKFVYYFRAYNYHQFYQPSVGFTPTYIDSLFSALRILYDNPVYWTANNTFASMRWETCMLMDIDLNRGKMYSYIKMHMKTLSSSFLSAGGNQTDGINSAASVLWRGIVNSDESLMVNIVNDSDFVSDLFEVINNSYIRDNHDYITLNYINLIGPLITNTNQTFINKLDSAINEYEPSISFGSVFHMKLMSQIYRHDNVLSGNWAQYKQMYFDWEFPNVKSFNDGEIIMHTNMQASRRNGIYLAMEEAKSNFFTLIGNSNPLSDDTNNTIKVYIYKNYEHYLNLSQLLFDINPVGGGVYIENYSSLYTFDREDELLPIQHLVKHEYVHYLDGRYNIPGTFGESSFYDWNVGRWSFWSEGLAELISSSPNVGEFGIQRLAAMTMMDDISLNSSQRMSLFQSTHNPTSNGYRTYAYSNTAWFYLYKNHGEVLKNMIHAVRENRINDYFNIIDNVSSSSANDAAYQTYLHSVAVEYSNTFDAVMQNGGPKNPYLFNPDMPTYDKFDSNNVSIEIIKETIKKEINNTYNFSVKYTDLKWVRVQKDTVLNGYSESQAIKFINNKINQKILKINELNKFFTGFEFVVGWIDSIEVNGNNTTVKISYQFPQFGIYDEKGGVSDTTSTPDPVNTNPIDSNNVATYSPIKLIAYPNPTIDYVTIDGNQFEGTCVVYDMSGRVLYSSPIKAEQKIQINMSNFSSGMYIIMVNNGKMSNSLKVIKR